MATTICIHGKQYTVIHKALTSDHDYKYSYDYTDGNTHIIYRIEFTRNKVVYDLIGEGEFDYLWLDFIEYDNINDAIKAYTRLRYDNTVLYVQMFTSVYHDGEIILEECKDSVMPSIADKPTLKRLENAENAAKSYKEKYERLQKFIDMYNIDDMEIDRRLKANNK